MKNDVADLGGRWMFSIANYRAAEDRALRQSPDLGKMHVHHFPRGSWPWNFTEQISELGSLLDVMHEDRFDHFVNEIGGFTSEERNAFVAAMASHIIFQRINFPHKPAVLPFDTLMAQFVVAKKIRTLKPNAQRVLEIGPGSGYLPFFLRDIEMLAQIEVAGSLYALQSMINSFLFGPTFRDLADEAPEGEAEKASPSGSIKVEIPVRCVHYPWWQMDKLDGQKFDVITSNANWNEMTTEARRFHLARCQKVLAYDGMIISQCIGGNTTGLDWTEARDLVWNDFLDAGFRPVFFVNRGNTETTNEKYKDLIRPLPLGQVVLVTKAHPWWSLGSTEIADFFCIDQPLIHRAFFHSSKGKRVPPRSELESEVCDLVNEVASQPKQSWGQVQPRSISKSTWREKIGFN